MTSPDKRDVVVVGGGIAGIAAATALAEQGLRVTLLEAAHFLGGRAGAWTETLTSGDSQEMERGFHAFFRQYYNLRKLLRRVDPQLQMLEQMHDYPIYGPNGASESFSNLPATAPFNVIALTQRTKALSLKDLIKVDAQAAMRMLAYDGAATYEDYDKVSAGEYLDSLRFPPAARRMLFDVFSHSFFNPESTMSAGELLMMFHFYFMANPEGLVFDVCKRPMSKAFWIPFAGYLRDLGVDLRLGDYVHSVSKAEAGYRIESDSHAIVAKDVVLALSVPALKKVLAVSPDLHDGAWSKNVMALEATRPFVVWRLWLNKPTQAGRSPFVGTCGLGIIDNVSLYHLFQDESRQWAEKHGGSVVELHAYAVPEDMGNDEIRADLLASLHSLYPETANAEIVDQRYLLNQDCPDFSCNTYPSRPGIETPHSNLVLAGDFVQLPFPSALMERAAASGFMAANTILTRYGKPTEKIESVAKRGMLASFMKTAPALKPSVKPIGMWTFGKSPQSTDRGQHMSSAPDWKQADPTWIKQALASSQGRPSGGWYVVDASAAVADKPAAYVIDGHNLVVWRAEGKLRVAPEACPHMGASLAQGRVVGCKIVCPWHGLALGDEGHGGWRVLPSCDDGVLFWVRLARKGEAVTDKPIMPTRPKRFIDAVVRVEANCEPEDVIANRLDPWHGTHYHPHSFGRLKVINRKKDSVTCRVVYRLLGRVGIEVDAEFTCPDPRTIVMTIIDGEGTGSVVETHATPIAQGRTAIVEATLATSERLGFRAARMATPALRPMIHWAARRLWIEDAAYAERRFSLRTR